MKPNPNLPITSSLVISCSDCDDCHGGLPVAVSVGTVMRNRTRRQRLSSLGNSREISVSANLSPFLHCIAATGQLDLHGAVVASYNCFTPFYFVVCSIRGHTQTKLNLSCCLRQPADCHHSVGPVCALISPTKYLHINCQLQHGGAASANQPLTYNNGWSLRPFRCQSLTGGG